MFCNGLLVLGAAYQAGRISEGAYSRAIDRLFDKADRVNVIHSAYRRRKR